MKFKLYQGPSQSPWDITGYVPQDSLSQLRAELTEHEPCLRASLTLELFNPDPDPDFRQRVREPGVLYITDDDDVALFALYYNPVHLEYDPAQRRYRLRFASLFEGLLSYLSRDKWWNALDAATLRASFKDFLAQYLPSGMASGVGWLAEGMSPLEEDPENTSWEHFAGFVQPASWLVGKEVDYSPNGPWIIINVLGVAASQGSGRTVYALCTAQRNGWSSAFGDYVWPVVVKARWNPEAWDWDIESMFWSFGNNDYDDPGTWSWPVWFGMRERFSGETGESVLIYTTTGDTERVVLAWLEATSHKPETLLDTAAPRLRTVLLDSSLNLLAQQTLVLSNFPVPSFSVYAMPTTTILRGVGFSDNGTPRGAVFLGVNGNISHDPGGGGPTGYGENGQDGIVGIYALRWTNNAWTDSSLQTIYSADFPVSQGANPMRILDVQAFPKPDELGAYHILYTMASPSTFPEGVELSQMTLAGREYSIPANSVSSLGGRTWTLSYETDTYPSVVMAVPVGPPHDNGVDYEAGGVFAYTIMDARGRPHGFFVEGVGGALDGSANTYPVSPGDGSGFAEGEINLDDDEDDLFDPHLDGAGWSSEERFQEAETAYLRALIHNRTRPFAIRYELAGDVRRVKFLFLLQNATRYEVFALSGEYDPSTHATSTYTIDGRDLKGEVVPKVAGGSFNRAETWRPVAPYPTLYSNQDNDDPRGSGHDHQGNWSRFDGPFEHPVGVASVPGVKKVCEQENIFSEVGKLGYRNMMGSSQRYWPNVYNAHRLFIITPLAWWSFLQTELDYRKASNLDLLGRSWQGAASGLSYVLEDTGQTLPVYSPRLVLVPRFPLKGDTHTPGGGAYWEENPANYLWPPGNLGEFVPQKRFGVSFLGRWWDALFLGPEGGALLRNIWWDDEGEFDRELVVSVKELLPQWFGIAFWRASKYNDLFAYLKDRERALGGQGARVGLRALALPVYGWEGVVKLGLVLSGNIMSELAGATDDPELSVWEDENGDTIPLYWQTTGIRWDLSRNTAVFTLKETRDTSWEAP